MFLLPEPPISPSIHNGRYLHTATKEISLNVSAKWVWGSNITAREPNMEDFAVEPETSTQLSRPMWAYDAADLVPPNPAWDDSMEYIKTENELDQTAYYHLIEEQQRRLMQEFAPPTKPKKRVRFAQDALLYSGDVTAQEISRCWCTADDFQSYKKERRNTIRTLRQNGYQIERMEDAGYCMRGLEPYFSLETNQAMKYTRQLAFRRVLEEQDRQRAVGIYDDETIREQAIPATAWARDMATQLGANDALEAERIQISDAQASSLQTAVVTNRARVEFVRTAAIQRQKSNRKIRHEESSAPLTQYLFHRNSDDDKQSQSLLEKLETALRLVDDRVGIDDNPLDHHGPHATC